VTRYPCTLSSEKNKKKLQKEKILMLRVNKGLRRPGCVAVFVKDNVVCAF
jgi:hypothetical protein